MPSNPSRSFKQHLGPKAGPSSVNWASLSFRLQHAKPDEICRCDMSTRSHVHWDGVDIKRIKWDCTCGADHVHWDEVAFRHGPTPLAISGGFGAAKTYAASLKTLYLSDAYPKNRGVVARKVGIELTRTTRSTFFKLCPPTAYDPARGGRRADSENYLRLAGSMSELLWIHLDDPDIEGLLRGLEINHFLLDQAEEMAEEVFDTLSARLGRWDQAVVPDSLLAEYGGAELWPWRNPVTQKPIPPIYSTICCNPDAEIHWIWRRFHPDSAEWRDKYSKMGYRMISMESYENRFLPRQNLLEMLNKDESFIRRFVRAFWGMPEGQIHEVRDDSKITGNPDLVRYLLERCSIYRTMDHGDAAPTCVAWWAVNSSGDCFCLGEYYQTGLVSEHRKRITELSNKVFGGKFYVSLADPAMFYKTQQKYGGRCSYADDYSDRDRKHGFNPDDAIDWMPADNDEMGTRNLINEYLRPQGDGLFDPMTGKDGKRPHPLTGEMGYWPRLYFLTKTESWPHGCDQVLMQMQAQRREKVGTELGKPVFSDDRQPGITDHAYDVVRYFVAARAPAQSMQAPRYKRGSFGAAREDYLKFKRQGGWRKLQAQLNA